MLQSQIFNIANMSFNVIRENKNLVKISEFTVFREYCSFLKDGETLRNMQIAATVVC